MHMYGANAAWDAKLVHASVYVGTRVPDYTLGAVQAKDRALIAGASLRLDLRDLSEADPVRDRRRGARARGARLGDRRSRHGTRSSRSTGGRARTSR